MTLLEKIIISLYGGITPAPIMIVFYFVYPILWARKSKISLSFAVLMLFSAYALFLLPGMLFSQIHHQHIFTRLDQSEVFDQQRSETQLLSDYRSQINDLELFNYDDCLVNSVSRNSLNEKYSLVCGEENTNRYIISITQTFKDFKVKVKVLFVNHDSSKIDHYKFNGFSINDYQENFGVDSKLEKLSNKSEQSNYSIVFSEALLSGDYNSSNLDVSSINAPERQLISRYISNANSFYIYLSN